MVYQMISDNCLMLHNRSYHICVLNVRIAFTHVDATASVPPTITDGEDCSQLFVILSTVFFATSVITTTISLILTCKLCGQKKENGMYDYSCGM